jgi:hypothetical protein
MPRLLLICAALLAVAWAGWRFAPDTWRTALRGDATQAPMGEEVDVCALASEPDLAAIVNRAAIEARHIGRQPGVPAAGVCTWEFFGGSIVGRIFTPASLSGGGVAQSAADYFASVATGLEYEFKQAPVAIAGLGDEAVASEGAQEPAQLAVRSGERVITLEYRGVDRAVAESFARAMLRKR